MDYSSLMKNNNLDCTALTPLDEPKFGTSNVIYTSSMFSGVSKVCLLDFVTSKVTNTSKIFQFMTIVKTLSVGDFDTKNVVDMSGMFQNCGSVGAKDVSKFKTSNVVDISCLFEGCSVVCKSSKITRFTIIFSGVDKIFFRFEKI